MNDNIQDESIKTLTLNSINVLNLKAEELRKKRKEAWDSFAKTWIDDFSQQIDIDTYLSICWLKLKQPFCFVNYHFIQNLMGV